jgi:hypothetical protein
MPDHRKSVSQPARVPGRARPRWNKGSLSVLGLCVVIVLGTAFLAYRKRPPAPVPIITPTVAPVAALSPKPDAHRHHSHRRTRATTTPSPGSSGHGTTAAPTGCYPLTNSGSCYQPGEHCLYFEEGTSGVDGGGQPIRCDDYDGWRWEPS